jgi:hypothetical protein
MTPLWTLQTHKAPAAVTLTEDALVLKNAYMTRTIDRRSGVTVSITDGDGTEALAAPLREGSVSVDGTLYTLEGDCKITLREGGLTEKKFDYIPRPYNTHPYPYPAPGRVVELVYPRGDVEIKLVYEIFDDMPVLRKTLYVRNLTDRTVVIDTAETEALTLTDEGTLRYYLEADYIGSNMYGFQKSPYLFRDGSTVSLHFDMGPDYDLPAGETFRGMQVYELYCQTRCFDHRMNEVQNMYRRVAPWVCEAPLFIHLISDNSRELRETADILADVGYDMIIQSFGSGINVESEDEDYIARVKADYDYVHEKGLTIGGYTLAIIRDYQPMNHDCATNGDHNQISRCLCTKWSEGYWNRILSFMEKTGTDFIEIDGPYHFNTCTGNREGQTEHLHKGFADSRYTQWLKSTVQVTARMKELGVYVNAPDWLYLSGTNKCAVGYEEIAFSQPRLTQLLMNRIYNYKGTYHKTPSMGWSFLPVEEYHGGGATAKFEPLTENLPEYDWALAQAAASGVWPCVRGKRLYDSETCRGVVKYWTDVMHRHKVLLNSNTVHAYPPTASANLNFAEDMDVILQENHTTPDKLFLMVCNQTTEPREKTLVLPAFYTGLTGRERPHTAPLSGSFDNVVVPSFGSWPPVYPKNLENLLAPAEPAEDSGIRMALYEHDLPENRMETMVDVNGNLILTVTLPPMSYTYYVGYAVDDGPVDPIPVPAGKPFGCPIPESEVLVASEIRKIDFDAIQKATSVDEVMAALGLAGQSIDSNCVVLHKNAYTRIHDLLHLHQPDTAENTMFVLAHVGLHTTYDTAVAEDELWLLDGWKR